MNNLEALRPIILPEQSSWWPLAPGWWILLVLLLALLTGFFWGIRKYRYKKALLALKSQAIADINKAWNLYQKNQQLNTLMTSLIITCKQCEIVCVPDQHPRVLTLSTLALYEQLRSNYPQYFDHEGYKTLFEAGPYANIEPANLQSIENLKSHIITWIESININRGNIEKSRRLFTGGFTRV